MHKTSPLKKNSFTVWLHIRVLTALLAAVVYVILPIVQSAMSDRHRALLSSIDPPGTRNLYLWHPYLGQQNSQYGVLNTQAPGSQGRDPGSRLARPGGKNNLHHAAVTLRVPQSRLSKTFGLSEQVARGTPLSSQYTL